jgi:hypothetical protein
MAAETQTKIAVKSSEERPSMKYQPALKKV